MQVIELTVLLLMMASKAHSRVSEMQVVEDR
jgi:hypothetical protein